MTKQQAVSFGSGSHRRLVAWQLGKDLVEHIYRLSSAFPADERFGLTAQIRRAAVSIPSNIAEGNQRVSSADKRHFATVARGSVAEVETQLEIAIRLKMTSAESTEEAFELLDHPGRALTNLRRAHERS